MRTGTVRDFDEHKGWGAVADDDGGEVEFHCTSIADGTRAIPVGQPVRFDLVPGLLGRWEAGHIEKVAAAEG